MRRRLSNMVGARLATSGLAAGRVARMVLAAMAFFLAGGMSAQGQEVGTPPPDGPRVVALDGNLEIDDVVEVTIRGLGMWSKAQGHSPWRLVPYLNDRALTGLYPVAVNVQTERVQFHLRLTPESRSAWNNVLSPPTLTRQVRFSVGLELQDSFDTALTLKDNLARLIVMEWEWVIAAVAVGFSFAFAFFRLAFLTPLLMERAALQGPTEAARYSLAKVQLAIWFFIIFGSFITIWLATGNHDTLNGSIVTTLGISAGTAIGDSYIKSNRDLQAREDYELVGDADADNRPSPAPGETASVPPAPRRHGFVRDLLSDSDGYSIYRFQMVAWTVVLTTIFVSNVYYNLVMPEFRPDLLYLLGLSSGTYIAHRIPETAREARAGFEQQRVREFPPRSTP